MIQMRTILLAIAFVFLNSCQTAIEKTPSAKDIVNKAIQYTGGEKLDHSKLSFDFRDIHYALNRNGGAFTMERSFEKDSLQVHDRYTNDNFERKINGEISAISDSLASLYRQSVNSVFYFALLPYKLNDASVIKDYLAIDTISGKSYHKIKISFEEEGGGEDFEDEFIYWYNTENYALDYLAYSFHTDGGGMRFREAYNEQFINGIRFVDYKNYKPKNKSLGFNQLRDAFVNGDLELLSKIELRNIVVD